MNIADDPPFDEEHVLVHYDLSSGRIVAYLPPCVDDAGDRICATVLDLSPSEAVELELALAAGITAAAAAATVVLLAQRVTERAPRPTPPTPPTTPTPPTPPAPPAPPTPPTPPVERGEFGLCTAPAPAGFLCTLTNDHVGDHIAHDNQGRHVAGWKR